MIVNGSSKSLSTISGMPQLDGALDDWMIWVNARIVTDNTISDYRSVEVTTDYSVQTVIQPFSSRQLMILPEGQRQWQWYTLHTKTALDIKLDDIVYFNDIRYRIMKDSEWGLNGYYEFQMIRDYTP